MAVENRALFFTFIIMTTRGMSGLDHLIAKMLCVTLACANTIPSAAAIHKPPFTHGFLPGTAVGSKLSVEWQSGQNVTKVGMLALVVLCHDGDERC